MLELTLAAVDQGRDGADTQFARQLRVIVDVDLCGDCRATDRFSRGFEDRPQRLAGPIRWLRQQSLQL